jgi:hypothetical protein
MIDLCGDCVVLVATSKTSEELQIELIICLSIWQC